MAYVRRLPPRKDGTKGKWQATVRHPSGRKLTKTDVLKRVVEEWGEAKERELRFGATNRQARHRITVGEWYTRWVVMRSVETSTARKDEGRWRNHIEPYWSQWPLESITRRDVQEWIKDMDRRGVPPTAVGGSYEYLSTILNGAVDEGFLAASPCRRIALPRRVKPEPRWLTRDEYDRLQLALGTRLTTLGGRQQAPDPHAHVWQAYVGLGCFSGLRPGELAGLDISAVDFDRQLVRVTQVVTREPAGMRRDGRQSYGMAVRPYPKTDRSIRSVPFPEEVGEMLWRVVADRGSGPVFTSPRGGRVSLEGNFRNRVWVPALEAAGIEPVRPYVMRHTCCSWLVQAGVPDRKIMAILGHANTHLIDLYGHLAPDAHDEVRSAWRRTGGATDSTQASGSSETRWSERPPGADLGI